MSLQSVDSLLPVLNILQQPAFCVKSDGAILSNPQATNLSPVDRPDLVRWLGSSVSLYEQWNRQTLLTLPLSLAGREFSVNVQALSDGDLFLLTPCDSAPSTGDTMTVSSQALRAPLSDLILSAQSLFAALEDRDNPVYRQQTAAITRNLYRLMRLAGNLSDYDRLSGDHAKANLSLVSLQQDIIPILEGLADLISETGSTLEYRIPQEQVQFYADLNLLEQALLNLISNALKHGLPKQTLRLQISSQPSSVLFRLVSRCDDDHRNLLSDAFRRLEQRGTIPDPRWGMGLGLPLVRRIAQLHGGSAALEARADGTVTVTMSVSRKRPAGGTVLETPIRVDLTGGMNRRLIELSEVLPPSVFELHL